MRRQLTGWALATLVMAGSGAAGEIQDLVPVIRDESIFVSFRVEGAFDERIARDVETGLEVTFRYNVQLKKVRSMWFDRLAASRQIRTTVVYDNRTKRYNLTRHVDGEIDRTEVVADIASMERFMTTFESLRLFDVSEITPNEEYHLRANGVMKDGNLLLLIPWDTGADWRHTRFTYLP